MIVIGPKGVVGKVTNVSKNYSLASSVLSSGFKVSATTPNGTTSSVSWGGLRDPYYAVLTGIPQSEKLKKGEKLFIILDEILKGTNSKDKAEGSKKFVKQLLKYEAAGIIATHDLSLCSVKDEHPEKIQNHYFDVEIENDQLVFDYKLKPGICSNMNAEFLMKKMGITE